MRWAKLKAIRSELESPEDVRAAIKNIRAGHGIYRDAEFEVHYDPRRKKRGQYDLVVMIPMEIPGAAHCAQCEGAFEPSNDYLCPSCRQSADS